MTGVAPTSTLFGSWFVIGLRRRIELFIESILLKYKGSSLAFTGICTTNAAAPIGLGIIEGTGLHRNGSHEKSFTNRKIEKSDLRIFSVFSH